jgi:hypothetical protein
MEIAIMLASRLEEHRLWMHGPQIVWAEKYGKWNITFGRTILCEIWSNRMATLYILCIRLKAETDESLLEDR